MLRPHLLSWSLGFSGCRGLGHVPGDSGCWEVDTVLVPALGKSNRTGFVETAVPTAGGGRTPEVGGLVVSVFPVTLI